ncbi:MAG: elongation factor G [Alphaproteobacteria bacterium]|nr:elongation factor G [Alphaproteobacteria bacterium]
MSKPPAGPRCAALVGPHGSGKTTLLESLLFVTETIPRKGAVKDGTTVGDSSPAARARQMSVESNIASARFMDEAWTFIDCPGSIEFAHEAHAALMIADIAIVVCEPSVDRAPVLGPTLKFLDDHQIPHLVFVNKLDHTEARMRDVIAAIQAVSTRKLVLRQVPIRDKDHVTGYVDLISERAYAYKPGKPSDLVKLPPDAAPRTEEARRELLEALADFDDKLLEQLLEDTVPSKSDLYADVSRTLAADQLVPVMIGAAEQDGGVRRLLKALRHDAPDERTAMKRLGIPAEGEPLAQIFKTQYAAHSGKLSHARIWRGPLADGTTLSDGRNTARVAGLFRSTGAQLAKLAKVEAGEVAALGRLEGIATGAVLTASGSVPKGLAAWPAAPAPLFALAIAAEKRADDVKLSGALQRLAEEDGSLSSHHDPDTGEYLLWGQGEMHLLVAADRLKTQYNVPVVARPPHVPYKETIRKPMRQHARHKRQSGGHGQFADVTVEIRPLERGQGFVFEDRIVGGAIPRNFIPSVEEGIREYLKKGPLGFPVVDLAATLVDGQFHAVDSSDAAFKVAGALAMREAMPNCNPVLLEPICKVSIAVPSEHTSKAQRIVSGRRGQILGFDAKPGWPGWDEVHAHLPQAEMHDLIVELRSLTMGIGTFSWAFDHLAEVTGKAAERVVAQANEAQQKKAAP